MPFSLEDNHAIKHLIEADSGFQPAAIHEEHKGRYTFEHGEERIIVHDNKFKGVRHIPSSDVMTARILKEAHGKRLQIRENSRLWCDWKHKLNNGREYFDGCVIRPEKGTTLMLIDLAPHQLRNFLGSN